MEIVDVADRAAKMAVGPPPHEKHGHLPADQIGGQFREPIVSPFRPAIFDGDVLAPHVAGLLQALEKVRANRRVLLGRGGVQEANDGHRRLLRAQFERPRSRTAEQRDELAPFYA
jgi:hypothetical protein